MKKHISIRYKLIFIFGTLIFTASLTESIFSIYFSRQAVTEKVTVHLIDKAIDQTEIIESKVAAFFQFLEGLGRIPAIQDSKTSFREKWEALQKETAFKGLILELDISSADGTCYVAGGTVDVNDRAWFRESLNGKKFISEPLISKTTGNLVSIFSYPLYDNNHTLIGIISADIDGTWFYDNIKDIKIGKIPIGKWLAIVITFHFVCFTFVIFNARDLDSARLMFQALLYNGKGWAISDWYNIGLIAAFALMLAAYPLLSKLFQYAVSALEKLPLWLWFIPITLALMLIITFAPSGLPNFIYANF